MRAAPVIPLRDNHAVCPSCTEPTTLRSGESKADAQQRHETNRPMCRSTKGSR